jgi:hypothetical protein
MPKKTEVREVPRGEARRSLAKAIEFAAVASGALADRRWTGAGLSAIHAGIAASDAGLIASAGVRSISQDHGSVVGLLIDAVPEFTEGEKRHISGLLALKNEVAYEQRLLTEPEARSLVDHATRLTRWAARVVAAHLD